MGDEQREAAENPKPEESDAEGHGTKFGGLTGDQAGDAADAEGHSFKYGLIGDQAGDAADAEGHTMGHDHGMPPKDSETEGHGLSYKHATPDEDAVDDTQGQGLKLNG